MINTKNEKKIDNHDYIVGFFPALYNYNLFLKVSAIAGDSLSELANTLMGEGDNYGGIGEAANKLLTSLYANDPEGKIILEILSQTQRDNTPINKDTFNTFYTGNMGEMMEALVYSCEVHFKHFFPKALLSGLQAKGDAVVNAATES